MNFNLLEVKEVVKQYSGHLALDRVSLQVPQGQIFGLLGPNGAGKTTLIRIINRITAPDRGEVYLGGRLSSPRDIYRIGYLPEERGLYKKMKVGEQALYLARLKGLSATDARKRLTRWFEHFDIMPWWNRKVEELSKGMQQKVQFITTVIHEPELLIFDEPFSGFDPVNAEQLKQEILTLKQQGHTIIFSTHNMASVEEICDRIALINRSRVVLEGEVADIRNRFHENRYRLIVEKRDDRPFIPIEGLFQLEDWQEEKNNRLRALIRKEAGKTNAELLSALSEHFEIVSFEEALPSMHDIFIRTVNQ